MTTNQVNDTIVSLLEAKGWHPSAGRAFCLGLDKSGRFTEIRDIVCAVKKTRIFSPRNHTDLEHPERLSVTTRRVLGRSGRAKFYPPYKMTRHELLLFMTRYPEVEVIYRSSKHDNLHAFHANARLVGTEILLGYVREHAAAHGGDPGSVTDLGGNETYHASRGRVIHCDAPITDARDKARYLYRDVYGGSNPNMRCAQRFEECLHKSDFAIGVHSTYGMKLDQIARGMVNRGIRAYFGVLTIPTNLKSLPDGEHVSDGVCVKIEGDHVSFTFPSDSSAAYTHSKTAILQYLWSRTTIRLGSHTFIYRILSIRGDCIFHSLIIAGEHERAMGPPLRVIPSLGKYYISIPKLFHGNLEVDAQPFDRMVLHAASARNFSQYDVTALYQYAKSLRMSLTINSVILSHGFASKPEDLVTMVIAAYSVAAAYKVESARFFKDATAQIDSTRDQGFFWNLLYLTTGTAKLVLSALAAASGLPYLYGLADTAVDSLVDGLPYLKVSVAPMAPPEHITIESTAAQPVKALGPVDVNKPLAVQMAPELAGLGTIAYADWVRQFAAGLSLAVVPVLSGPYPRRILVSYLMHDCGNYPLGRGFSPTPPASFLNPYELDLPTYRDWALPCFDQATPDAYRVLCDAATMSLLAGVSAGRDIAPPKLSKYGDFIFDVVSTKKSYVVRGVGNKMVVVSPFPGYPRRSTSKFLVRYDCDITELCAEYFGFPNERTYFQEVAMAGMGLPPGSVARSVLAPSSPAPAALSVTSAVNEVDAGLFESEADEAISIAEGSPPGGGSSASGAVGTPLPSPSLRLPPALPASDAGTVASLDLYSSDSGECALPDLSALPDGYNAVAEFIFMNSVFRKGIIGACSVYYDLALAIDNGIGSSRSTWSALSAATPSQPTVVEIKAGTLWNVMAGSPCTYGGVYWRGGLITTRQFLADNPVGTMTVTCDELEVYTVDGLDATANALVDVDYTCPSTLRNGVASAGKTYYILTHATVDDYVVCETSAALEELKDGLLSKSPGFAGRVWTVDSALHNRRVVEGVVDTLWVDEALRLHAAKLYLLMRMLKPRRMVAFGDDKQIGPSTFMEGYDYSYFQFPYDHQELVSVARTMLPCFAYALSSSKFYGRRVTTHNRTEFHPEFEVYSFENIRAAAAERPDTVVLTYTRAYMYELRALGVDNAYTIGRVQGKRFDHVIIVRHVTSKLVLFYDKPQSLVAVTRARKSVRYFTPTSSDDSVVADIFRTAIGGSSKIIDHVV